MLNLIHIVIYTLLNIICTWSITMLYKDKYGITWKHYLKCFLGVPIGFVLSLLIFPITVPNTLLFALMGGTFGEILTLFFLTTKQTRKEDFISYYDDGTPAKFFITGDKHRDFEKVKAFCHHMNTRRKDVLIILGDACFNYYEDKRDDALKKEISQLNITLFCIQGNKENRPQNVGTYGVRNFCGGKVYYEPAYPNIYFAIDGEIYTFEGKKYMVVGGAHSVDKMHCLAEGLPFWFDEMPDNKTMATVKRNLKKEGYKIHGMMTHTCPISYLPTEAFRTRQMTEVKQNTRKAKRKKVFKPDINRTTEIWLDELEKNLDYNVWFCGHFHVDKQIDKIQMMYQDIRPLHMRQFGEK